VFKDEAFYFAAVLAHQIFDGRDRFVVWDRAAVEDVVGGFLAFIFRKQIEQGIARLSDAIDDVVDDPSADVNALLVKASVPPPAPPAKDAPPGPQLSPPTGSSGKAPAP
jgi:hypothetical protein